MKRNTSYGYSTVLEREETICKLLEKAKEEKSAVCQYWKKMRRYYDGDHDIKLYSQLFASKAGIPWTPTQSTDGYIHVESMLQPQIPDFEFAPRDKTDYDKAKQRESIVRFILDNNSMDYKNSRAERSLNIYGSAAYKVCWDTNARFSCDDGDVTVENVDISRLYCDPNALDVDGCEYIAYVYPMHKNRVKRVFENDFEARGESFESYLSETSRYGSAFDDMDMTQTQDTVNVCEWWFRQPKDGSCTVTVCEDGIKRKCEYSWKAGDIALSVLIAGKEIRYLPKYWQNTCFDNFPFVIYSRLPSDKSIWGTSELEQIIPLIDAKDRELAFAQLNSAFSSNDIIVTEENALCDGESLDNSPGAVWKLRPGMMGKVSRLGNGSSYQSSLYSNASHWENLIESTVGNFEVSQGKEPVNVTTATGIALLNERSQTRKNLKNADRTYGFKRLYSLIDMTALEYYNNGRIIRIGKDEDGFVFNFGGYISRTRRTKYIPSMDVVIHLGSGIENSRSFTLSSLTALMSMNINADNYVFAKAYLRSIAIPESEELCAFLDKKYGGVDEQNLLDAEHLLTALTDKENENE